MPALATPFGGSLDASSRRARTSGHRALVLAVERAPSVIELPYATMTPVARSLATSTPARKGTAEKVLSGVKTCAPLKSPLGER